MKPFLILGFLLLSMNIAAECKPTGNQMQMNECASENLAKVDKELNDVYQSLMKVEKNNTLYIEKLRISQRIWVKFRDAELDAMFSCDEENIRYCWGSMYGMIYPNAKAELTRERVKRLKRYLEEGQNVAVDGR